MRLALVCAAVVVAGCFSPRFTNGSIRCTTDSNCPRAYHCAVATHTCYQDGQDPDPVADMSMATHDLSSAGDLSNTLADDTRSCSADSQCPDGYYCTLVGTCFHNGAAPARCPRFALFCDDFEGHARLPWGAPVSGGSVAPPAGVAVTVDNTAAYPGPASVSFHGMHGLHTTAPGTSQTPSTTVYWSYWPYVLPTPLQGPATIAWRGYVYAARAPVEQPYFAYLHTRGQQDGFNLGSANGSSTAAPTWAVFNKLANSYAFDNPQSSAIAAGRWYCVEMVLTIGNGNSGTSNVVDLYVDTALLNSSNASGAMASAAVSEIDVGITWSQSSQDNEIYLDDVVVAQQRIGCE
jgi:hypothetical protein